MNAEFPNPAQMVIVAITAPESFEGYLGDANFVASRILDAYLQEVLRARGQLLDFAGGTGPLSRSVFLLSVHDPTEAAAMVKEALAGLGLDSITEIAIFDDRELVWRLVHPPGGLVVLPQILFDRLQTISRDAVISLTTIRNRLTNAKPIA